MPSTVSEQLSATPEPALSDETTGSRSSPDELADGMEKLALEGGITGDDRDFYLCMADSFLASNPSTEASQATQRRKTSRHMNATQPSR